jgi:hypothetical protein
MQQRKEPGHRQREPFLARIAEKEKRRESGLRSFVRIGLQGQTAGDLPTEQQQELWLFLATRLQVVGGPLPPPRDIPLEKIPSVLS